MNQEYLKTIWKEEESLAHIHGWDFSHINNRYEIAPLPWNYQAIVKKYLTDDMQILDYDTGGGEFLLSLHHPHERTSATEGFEPNIKLCRERLVPLGISFRECSNPAEIPYNDATFDFILNRHGSFHPLEIFRLLKPNGIFITQQVGCDNDRELIDMVLPGTPKPFPHQNLTEQSQRFSDSGFQIMRSEEIYCPIRFFDVGAFVWFARIISWEFPNFSVDRCFSQLCKMQEDIDKNGKIEGTIHRFLIIAKKTSQSLS